MREEENKTKKGGRQKEVWMRKREGEGMRDKKWGGERRNVILNGSERVITIFVCYFYVIVSS